MKPSSIFLKSFSIFLSYLIVANSVSAHAPAATVWADRRMAYPSVRVDLLFATPPENGPSVVSRHGAVRAVDTPAGKRPRGTVLLLQDVHGNREAQENAGKIVAHLIREGKTNVVGLEGAFGPLPLGPVRRFPHADVVGQAADALFNAGEMTGPARAALLSDKDVSLIGVDDARHYERNVQAYRDAFSTARARKAEWTEASALNDRRKKQVFNPALARYDAAVASFQAGGLGFGSYVQRLAAGRAAVPPEAALFLEALALERAIKVGEVERQRARLLSALTPRLNPAEQDLLVKLSAAARDGRLSSAAVYERLASLCANKRIRLDAYPAMRDYVRYLALAGRLKAEHVLPQVQQMERDGYARLIQNNEEGRLVNESRRLYLVGKLLDFALTKDEWEEYKGEETPPSLPLSHRDKGRNINLSAFERFYQEAEIRDGKIAENFLREIKNRKTSVSGSNMPVLVAGGFHSEGVRKKLTDAGFSVVTVLPHVSRCDAKPGSYLTVFNREKTPLEKMFQGDKLFLADAPVNMPNLLARMLSLHRTNYPDEPELFEHEEALRRGYGFRSLSRPNWKREVLKAAGLLLFVGALSVAAVLLVPYLSSVNVPYWAWFLLGGTVSVSYGPLFDHARAYFAHHAVEKTAGLARLVEAPHWPGGRRAWALLDPHADLRTLDILKDFIEANFKKEEAGEWLFILEGAGSAARHAFIGDPIQTATLVANENNIPIADTIVTFEDIGFVNRVVEEAARRKTGLLETDILGALLYGMTNPAQAGPVPPLIPLFTSAWNYPADLLESIALSFLSQGPARWKTVFEQLTPLLKDVGDPMTAERTATLLAQHPDKTKVLIITGYNHENGVVPVLKQWTEPIPPGLADRVKSSVPKELSLREEEYPDATLTGNEPARGFIMDVVKPVRLVIKGWNELDGEPFTDEEEKVFASGDGVITFNELQIKREEIKTLKQSYWDRSSGVINVRLVIEKTDGTKLFVRHSGLDSSGVMHKMKVISSSFQEMEEAGAIAQISKGNHADLQGYFTIFPSGNGWTFSGAGNENRERKDYKVLIEYKNGRRELAEIRMEEDPASRKINRILSRPKGSEGEFSPLDPAAVEFVMSTYALAWGNLREYYNAGSDLRHLIRFPFIRSYPVFYDQVAPNDTLRESVFQFKPVTLRLAGFENESIRPDELKETMVNRMGYTWKESADEVVEPGDFHFNGDEVRVVLLPARYPVNGLAVSDDGTKISFVAIPGLSGRKGPNYWNLDAWLEEKLGWKPGAFFIFDNGMDPTWKIRQDGKMISTPVKGRDHVGSTMLVFPLNEAETVDANMGKAELVGVEALAGPLPADANTAVKEIRQKRDAVVLADDATAAELDNGGLAKLIQVRLQQTSVVTVFTQTEETRARLAADLASRKELNGRVSVLAAPAVFEDHGEQGKAIFLDELLRLLSLDDVCLIMPSDWKFRAENAGALEIVRKLAEGRALLILKVDQMMSIFARADQDA